jgi:hypothetical protein
MRRNRIAQAIAELAETLSRPRYLRIRATIKVHGRRAEVDGTRCPCCSSPDAEIVQELDAGDLVIDLQTGQRISAAEVTTAEWGELCGLAETHELAVRCSTKTLPLLLDDSDRHIFASGGNRAAKTTTGLAWLALQWLRRGGRERRYWLVAPTDGRAFRLLSKLFRGTGESPPILPAALIDRAPDSHRASNLETRLVDGSLFDLRTFANDPGAERLKSDAIVAAVVDEAAHLPSPNSLSALRGRCVDAAGRLWFASTPRPSSFLKATVVDQALEFERLPAEDPRKASGRHEGAAWLFTALPMLENPWVPLANIEREMRTLDMSKPEYARDAAGTWVADEGLYWEGKFDPERHVYDHEERDLATWSPSYLARVGAAGHVPITGYVRQRICSSPSRNPHHATIRSTNSRFLIGQDVNLLRMESVVTQVSAPPDQKHDPDTWHVWVQDCVTSVRTNDASHAARLVSVELSKVFDPRGSTRTLDGCLVVMDPTFITEVDAHQRRHGQSGSVVDIFARHNLEVRAPTYRLSKEGGWKKVVPGRAPRFAVLRRLLAENRLHVASRCGPLLEAFATQLSEPDGHCPLDARHGKWDERMGPVDALKDLVYACVNAKTPTVLLSNPGFVA